MLINNYLPSKRLGHEEALTNMSLTKFEELKYVVFNFLPLLLIK
jgi:hypothetical protein